MTVYVITRGEYSDYRIVSVSLDKEDAERKCALLNKDVRCGEYCEIEEYDTEDIKVDTAEEVKKRFEMEVSSRTGEIKYFYESYLTFGNINDIHYSKKDCFNCGNDKYIKVVATLPKDTTKEQAKKIMLDRIAKFKAEKAGI